MTFKRSFSSTVLIASVAGALAFGFIAGRATNQSFSFKPPKVEASLLSAEESCGKKLKSQTGFNAFLRNELNKRDEHVRTLNAQVDETSRNCQDTLEQINSEWKETSNQALDIAKECNANLADCAGVLGKCQGILDKIAPEKPK